MKFITPYNKPKERSLEFATYNDEESMTQQSDAQDCDINVIWERYTKTGQLPTVNLQAMTGDFTNVPDFRTAQEVLKAANDAFAEVPAKIRARFNNDPDEFVKFALDDNNTDELRKMGLAIEPPAPPPEPPPTKVIITNAEPPKEGPK